LGDAGAERRLALHRTKIIAVIRWLALLLVLLVLPAPKVGASSAGTAHPGAQLALWSSDAPSSDWSVVACDDDDDDDDNDSVPPAPEWSDDDVLAAGAPFAIAPGDVLTAARLFHDTGLRPARGHARAPELPPLSA
jgi:hypothetical protein